MTPKAWYTLATNYRLCRQSWTYSKVGNFRCPNVKRPFDFVSSVYGAKATRKSTVSNSTLSPMSTGLNRRLTQSNCLLENQELFWFLHRIPSDFTFQWTDRMLVFLAHDREIDFSHSITSYYSVSAIFVSALYCKTWDIHIIAKKQYLGTLSPSDKNRIWYYFLLSSEKKTIMQNQYNTNCVITKDYVTNWHEAS